MSKTPELESEGINKIETKDIYAVYKQNVRRYFENSERNIGQYMQAFSNIQQEFVTAYRNAVEAAIEFQQEVTSKSGFNADLPPIYLKTINNMVEEQVKTRSFQSKATLAVMEATRQNFKTFNDIMNTFATMDAQILQR